MDIIEIYGVEGDTWYETILMFVPRVFLFFFVTIIFIPAYMIGMAIPTRWRNKLSRFHR